MPVVVDSSALIGLARVGQFKLLRQLYDRVLIPEAVRSEVVDAGRQLGKGDVEAIEEAILDGWIIVQRLGRQLQTRADSYRDAGVGRGEAECAVLAASLRTPAVFDDRRARRLARLLDLEFTGTGGALLEARSRRLLGSAEFLASLRDLARVTRLSAEVMAELIRRGLEVEQ